MSLRDKLSDEVVHYKPKWDPKAQPAQDASFLVKLRNEIVHYKSKWGRKMEMEEETKKLLESFRQKRHPRPPFIVSGMNFFPHEILSATCAAWAVDTAVAFLDMFYGQLGVASPIESQRASFNPR